MSDAGDWPSDEALRQYKETLREIFALRGEFVSGMSDLEETLDGGVLTYFDPQHHADNFVPWLLARLPIGAKVELVRQIVTDVGVLDYFKPAIAEFERLNKVRNGIAHSYVAPARPDPGVFAIEVDLDEMLANPTQYRTTNKGRSTTAVEIKEIKQEVERLTSAWYMATRFQLAMLAANRGGANEVAKTLRQFDFVNTDHPPIR